ncbi:MAG: hypothetical protein ACLPX1_00270 [Steroidobacteraceae bacterium]
MKTRYGIMGGLALVSAWSGAHKVKVVAKEITEKTKKVVEHGTGDHSGKQREP